MTIEFSCSQCGHRLRVRDDAAGKSGRCKGCGERVAVPSSKNSGSPRLAPAAPADVTNEPVPQVPSGASPASASATDADPMAEFLAGLETDAHGRSAGRRRTAGSGSRPKKLVQTKAAARHLSLNPSVLLTAAALAGLLLAGTGWWLWSGPRSVAGFPELNVEPPAAESPPRLPLESEERSPAGPALSQAADPQSWFQSLQWDTAETLNHVNPLQQFLTLTEQAKKRGMVFLVVEVDVPTDVLEIRQLTGEDLEEFNRDNRELDPDGAEEAWSYDQNASQYKLHTQDGSTVTAEGFKSGNAFWPVGGLRSTLQKKPEMLNVGVFFTAERDSIESGEVTFQIRNSNPIPLTDANRRAAR